jgi:hypothetical protein
MECCTSRAYVIDDNDIATGDFVWMKAHEHPMHIHESFLTRRGGDLALCVPGSLKERSRRGA